MSSILKALKKLEDAKATRSPGSLHFGTHILHNERPHRFSLPGVILVSGLLFICGGGVTYLYMKGATAPPTDRPPIPYATAPATTPQQPLPGADTRTVPPGVVAPQTHATPRTVALPPAKSSAQQHVTLRPAPRPDRSNSAGPAAPAVRTAPTAAETVPAVGTPAIKVNGIAFQGEGAGSVAVVNGIPVAIGSVVEGARVEDIQKDRVRFSYDGARFEVGLGKSNR